MIRRTRSPPALPVPSAAEQKTKYLALQQDADFALWRAREANTETRLAYQAALDGQGPAPSSERLAELRQLEQQAETRHRELRAFVRDHFEQLAVLA
jgi:hypothetical protein